MKVLQILPELAAGGVERGTLEIARYLRAQGHQSIVVSNGGRLVEKLELEGSRHITMPVHRKSLSSLFRVVAFRKLLLRESPDILHIRSRVPGWIALLAWHGLPPSKRPHLVSTVHGFYSVNAYSAVMTRGERVIAVSRSIHDYIIENYPRVSPERIRCVPRGIDLKDYPRGWFPSADWVNTWNREYPELRGRRLLALPGRITRLKGHEDFLQLIKALVSQGRNVHGLIVGDAHPRKKAYLEEIKALCASLGIADRVTFTGHRSDLREVLAISGLTFCLSTQPESFGRTALEALALGKPVIGYDHGGVGEQLSAMQPEGRVALRDENELQRVTCQFLEKAPPPAMVPPEYTLEQMCLSTLDIYREIVPNA
jgi:glycosyltransferase involved in cell wall biosynthesis